MEGQFELASGTKLKIVVGQRGLVKRNLGTPMTGGGGGGTFVTLVTDSPLIIAGGGGGGADTSPSKGGMDGDPGQSTINGTRCGGSGGVGDNFAPMGQAVCLQVVLAPDWLGRVGLAHYSFLVKAISMGVKGAAVPVLALAGDLGVGEHL